MKLHLPKRLFTALLTAITLAAAPAALTLGSAAWGLSVIYEKSFSTDGSGVIELNSVDGKMTYDYSTGILTLPGEETSSTIDFSMLYTWDIDDSVTFIKNNVSGAYCGLVAKKDGTIVGSAVGTEYGDAEDISLLTEAYEMSGNSDNTIRVTATISQSDGVTLQSYDSGKNLYRSSTLKYGPTNDNTRKWTTLTFDKSIVKTVYYQVEAGTEGGITHITSSDGAWEKTYTSAVFNNANTKADATVLNDGTLEVEYASDALSNLGNDIIVGGGGQLRLQTWGGDNSARNRDIDISDKKLYLESNANGDAALSLGVYCGDITLGDIQLIGDTKITKEFQNAGSQVIFAGNVSGDYTLTLAPDRVGQDCFDGAVFTGSVDVKKLDVAANSEITFSGGFEADEFVVGSNSTISLTGAENSNLGTLTLESGSSLTVTGEGKEVYITTSISNSGGSISLGAGVVLDITGVKSGVNADDFLSYVSGVTTAKDAFVKVAFNHTSSLELKHGSDITLGQNVEAVGALIVHGSGSDVGRQLNIGEGITLKAMGATSGSDREGLEAINHGIINITGGNVQASTLVLGHESGEGAYWGKLLMSSGSLQLDTIRLRQNHANVFSVTGGQLEFTSETALNRGNNSLSTISIGGTKEAPVVLKATQSNWTLNGEGLTTLPSVGHVEVDADNNTHVITLKNVNLTGSIANNAALVLGDKIDFTAAALGTENAIITLGSGASLTFAEGVKLHFGELATNTEYKIVNATGGSLIGWDSISANQIWINGNQLDASSYAVTLANGVFSYSQLISSLTWVGGTEGVWSSTSEAWSTGSGSNVAYANMVDTLFASPQDDSGLVASVLVEGTVASKNLTIEKGVDLTLTASEGASVSATNLNISGNLTSSIGIVVNGSLTMGENSSWALTSGAEQSLSEAQLNNVKNMQIASGATLTVDNFTTAAGGKITATQLSGDGTLSLMLSNSGDGLKFDLSNFGGDIHVLAASGQSEGKLLVNGSTFHADADIFLIDKSSLVFNEGTEDTPVVLANDINVQNGGSASETGKGSNIHVASGKYATLTGSLDGTGQLFTFGPGTLTIAGTSTLSALKARSGTLVITGGVTSTYLGVGDATLNVEGTVSTNQLRMSEQGSSSVWIKTGAEVNITGSENGVTTSRSLLLAHWGNASTLTLAGGTLNSNAAEMFLSWTGTGTFDAQSGEANLLGINFLAQSNQNRGSFKLGTAEGANAVRVNLGASGFKNVNGSGVTLTLGNGTLGATSNWTMEANTNHTGNVQLVGTNGGTVFNTENAKTPGTGHTITVNAVLSGSGNLVKDGKGTLELNGTNTYTGSTSVLGGELVVSKSNGNSTSSYDIAKNATLKVTDFTGSWDKTITGDGTLSLVIGETTDHSNNLQGAGGFNGVLEISKDTSSSNRGNTNLLNYDLGDDASLKLVSGNHWGDGDITLAIELAGTAENHFAFQHNNTLTLSGKVTGTYLTTGRNYDDNMNNTLILSGAGSEIEHVIVSEEGTLTVNNNMSFGTVTAANLAVGNGYKLTLGTGTSATTQSVAKLTASGATVNLLSQTELNLGGGTENNPVTHSIGTLIGGTGSKLNLAQHSVLNKVSTVNGTVTLTGSGTYDLEALAAKWETGNAASILGVTLADDWTGVVKVSGTTISGDNDVSGARLNDLAKANSWVELDSVEGWIYGNTSGGYDHAVNLILSGTGLTIKTSSDRWYGFSKSVKGTGDFTLATSSGDTQSYNFTGDISEWAGAFVVNANGTATPTTTLNLTGGGNLFSGAEDSGVVMNRGGVLNVNIGKADADTTMRGSIGFGDVKTGTLNLTVQGDTEFQKSVEASQMTVTSGKTATFNNTATADTVQLGETATITGKQGAAATMTKVQMSSTGGITGTAQDGSSSISDADIEVLAQDASFTIADMTLTNTSITAASVNFSNSKVSGNVVLNVVKPTEAITAPNVGQGGTGEISFTYGLALVDSSSTLTLNMEVPQAILPSDSGLYNLTITLNGFAADFNFSNIANQVVFGADSWLGKALQGATPVVTVNDSTLGDGAAAAQSASGAPSVSYAATGGNVGSLVITITGLNVPEPTTSTLSLLALAALVARRRRK